MTSIKNSAENWYLTNCNDFIDGLVSNELFLDVEYESDSVDYSAYFFIKFNDCIIKKLKLAKEVTKLTLNLIPTTGVQILELGLIGKLPGGTLVQDGIIIKDTFVKLIDLKINNYKLLHDFNFFFNKTEYTKLQNFKKIKPLDGFWEDASLKIKFEVPFDLWYNNVSTQNTTDSASLKFRTSDNHDDLHSDLEKSLKKLL